MKKAAAGDHSEMLGMMRIDPDGVMSKLTTRNAIPGNGAAAEPELPISDGSHPIGSDLGTPHVGNGLPGSPGADTRRRASNPA